MAIELSTGIVSWDLERARKPEQENRWDCKAHHVEYEEAPERHVTSQWMKAIRELDELIRLIDDKDCEGHDEKEGRQQQDCTDGSCHGGSASGSYLLNS